MATTEEGKKRKKEKQLYYLENKERIKKRDYTNNCMECGIAIHFSADRCRSCCMKGVHNNMHGKILENAPSWKGGISFGDYGFEFNRTLKEKIKVRDNHTCQICHKIKIVKGTKKLHLAVHHKDFDKKNNQENNLQTTCCPCHDKIHSELMEHDKLGRFKKNGY